MITDGFIYIAVLIFVAAVLVYIPSINKNQTVKKFLNFAPPVVLIYLTLMGLCTLKFWDLEQTAGTYSALKNPLLYAMLFLMLLRCDLRKIIKLGPKMIIGFLAASISIGLGFVISFVLFKRFLGTTAWKTLGALCGSWMGGGGNMLAIQAALDVQEGDMAYALVMDSVCASLYVIFLLWAIGFSKIFNSWTKADTGIIDEVGRSLEKQAQANTAPITYQKLIFLLGCSLVVSAYGQKFGVYLNSLFPFLDKVTWCVLGISVLGMVLAMTPLGKIKGTEELSTVLLYITIALIASRADLSVMANAHYWLLAGVLILAVHVVIMIIVAKILKLDIFTCCVASLANIGGTATAPILAGAYNSALVPVGIIMALFGYLIGTGGGLVVAYIMKALV